MDLDMTYGAAHDKLSKTPVFPNLRDDMAGSAQDPELLQKTRYSERAGGWVAPLGQVLVDLKTFPGREADLANQIIDSLSELGSDSEYGWTMWSEKKEAKTK